VAWPFTAWLVFVDKAVLFAASRLTDSGVFMLVAASFVYD